MIATFYRTFRTYCIWIFVSPVLLGLCCAVAILPSSYRYDSKLYFILTTWWARCLMFATFTDVRYNNRSYIRSCHNEPTIFVLNHSSALDIPLAETVIGSHPHIWLIKKEYEKIPIFGWLFARMHVLVDRRTPRSAFLSLRQALDLVTGKNRHLIIFTEGTRSDSGELLPFMRGFAFLAKKLNRPVVPILLQGVHKVLPKNAWMIQPKKTTIEVTVGTQMRMQKDEPVDAFVLRVEAWFSSLHTHAG